MFRTRGNMYTANRTGKKTRVGTLHSWHVPASYPHDHTTPHHSGGGLALSVNEHAAALTCLSIDWQQCTVCGVACGQGGTHGACRCMQYGGVCREADVVAATGSLCGISHARHRWNTVLFRRLSQGTSDSLPLLCQCSGHGPQTLVHNGVVVLRRVPDT